MSSRLTVALLAMAVICSAVAFVPAEPAYATDRTVVGELFGSPY